jgi:hypothetical protein
MTGTAKVRVKSEAWFGTIICFVLTVACFLYATAPSATDADDYRRRAAQRDLAMFDALDRDKDERLTVYEVRGNVDLEARFNDFDVNRDGVITRQELMRYVTSRYDVASTQ